MTTPEWIEVGKIAVLALGPLAAIYGAMMAKKSATQSELTHKAVNSTMADALNANSAAAYAKGLLDAKAGTDVPVAPGVPGPASIPQQPVAPSMTVPERVDAKAVIDEQAKPGSSGRVTP